MRVLLSLCGGALTVAALFGIFWLGEHSPNWLPPVLFAVFAFCIGAVWTHELLGERK